MQIESIRQKMWFTGEHSRAAPDKKHLLCPHANKKIELIEQLSIEKVHTLEKMQPLQHNWAFPMLISRFSKKW